MKTFARELPKQRTPAAHPVTAWGITFPIPLWNAAGMFKNGEAYATVARQGAGAYVAGTTTSRPRAGNIKNGIQWPAVPYPRSRASSNWMGLPNEGHAVVASRLAKLERKQNCPVGASVSAEPALNENEALPELVEGMAMYDRAGVDYIELNESCPNVPGSDHRAGIDENLVRRLNYVSEKFLAHRQRRLPVVVKFSTDTNPDQLPTLLDTLTSMNFDGIILGNTSVQYKEQRPLIHPREQKLYDTFVSSYGGGLSGALLRDDSLALCRKAVLQLREMQLPNEFHVIRCGGVFTAANVNRSAESGVMLNQWYTGYFEAFAQHGHDLYEKLASALV